MFAYYAFKSLIGKFPDALKSPRIEVQWGVDPDLGLPYLSAAEGTFERGHGVYAATLEEAAKVEIGQRHDTLQQSRKR